MSAGPARPPGGDDAAKAIRFMLVKAAVFILLPAVVAAAVVYLKLYR